MGFFGGQGPYEAVRKKVVISVIYSFFFQSLSLQCHSICVVKVLSGYWKHLFVIRAGLLGASNMSFFLFLFKKNCVRVPEKPG